MTREAAIDLLDNLIGMVEDNHNSDYDTALHMAIKELKEVDISDMLYDIYMQGVNMAGEYQGCWVRFKDIERIVKTHIGDK